ncbi:hypothetical protein ELS19_19765 [Halogeometricum borinquense]|uniref:Uncharacterized protein n=1 Tax=Halogeometricum borinquense TaxID=60847 RepID=A0A482SYI6_9EURY|nr:hypothetical protein [Halogeometricum borinquense]RYJ08031.1 hypothetical protein ELS19_19765 [Halogeometricum borinquense]
MNGAEITVSGGSIVAVLIGLGLALATIALGAWIAIKMYRGYRRSGDRPTFYLAIGIGLASAAHTTVRVLLSTLDVSLLLVNVVATAVQFAGLIFVLYAVYGDPARGVLRVTGGAAFGGAFLLTAPLLIVELTNIERLIVVSLSNGVTAVLGGFIAVQAYRGYHRYDQRPMLLLALGIGLLTVGSFTVLNLPAPALTAASRIGLTLAVEFAGLLSIAVSLRGNRTTD